MRTTFDIDPASYRLVKAIAAQRGVTMGMVVNEAIQNAYGAKGEPSQTVGKSSAGFPTLSVGRPITPEDVAEALDE